MASRCVSTRGRRAGAPLSNLLRGGVFQPAVEPAEHRLMPEEGVGGFQDKMVFIRKIEEATGDAPALEGGKGGEPLGHGDAEVEPAMDDEHGGLPAVDEADGVPALVT